MAKAAHITERALRSMVILNFKNKNMNEADHSKTHMMDNGGHGSWQRKNMLHTNGNEFNFVTTTCHTHQK